MATTAGKSTQQQQTTPASPAAVTHLHGSCSCGRNQYVVSIPLEQREYAAVYFDNGSDGRLTNGAPITAFLRIPLTWYSSSTYAYTPQESPSSIRRVFAPHDANPYARRTFCGYCGTPLTYWTEQPDGEGGFMSVTVGSLRGRDQEKLEELGLLPEEMESTDSDDEEEQEEDGAEVVHGEIEEPGTGTGTGTVARNEDISSPLLQPPPFSVFHRTGNLGGLSWFEDMIQGSRLGRTQRARRGMGKTPDDTGRVQWEVSEWNDDDSSGFGQAFASHQTSNHGFSSTTIMSSTSTTHVMSSSSGRGSRRLGGGGVKRKSPEIEEIE